MYHFVVHWENLVIKQLRFVVLFAAVRIAGISLHLAQSTEEVDPSVQRYESHLVFLSWFLWSSRWRCCHWELVIISCRRFFIVSCCSVFISASCIFVGFIPVILKLILHSGVRILFPACPALIRHDNFCRCCFPYCVSWPAWWWWLWLALPATSLEETGQSL